MFGLLTSLAMFACSGDKATDTSSVEDTAVADEGCGVEIDETYPALNAADVYYLSNLTVELSDPDETASLTLTDASGAEVAGEVSVDDDTLTFAPSAALAPSTSYNLNVSYCGSEEPAVIPFTTSALGTAIDGGNEITSRSRHSCQRFSNDCRRRGVTIDYLTRYCHNRGDLYKSSTW